MESRSESFGQIHFGQAELGDRRRTKRLVELADAIQVRANGTIPQMFPRSADQEALYHLFHAQEVTHEAVLAAHRDQVLKELQTTEKFLLVIHDSTELDFTTRKSLKTLGQIGNGRRRGYVVQNSLVVDPAAGEVLGLAQQVLHLRPQVPANEAVAAKRERESRESRLWLQGTAELPGNPAIVDVCDRGADTFEFLEQECQSGRTFVIRSTYSRVISVGHEGPLSDGQPLHAYLRSLPPLVTNATTVHLAPREPDLRPNQRPSRMGKGIPEAREARLCISAAAVRIHAPHVHRGEHGDAPLVVWAVRVWEPAPPEGCEPLEWFLLTNHPVTTIAAAQRVHQWYELRWIVEEYHKAQKTGCGIENLQFRDEERLEPAIAFLSIMALTLLQLREMARRPDAATRPASTLVERHAVRVLSLWETGTPRPDWSVSEYYLALAKLGGYRRRKDCPPGWQILWRGQVKLLSMLAGYRLAIDEK